MNISLNCSGLLGRSKMMRPVAAILVVSVLFCPSLLRAQATSASVSGRIADPSKARIADARVAAVNAGTNARYESRTNGSGEYSLPNIPPGNYRIEVEKEGFRTLIKPDLIVHVQDVLAIDFEMPVGSTSDSVTVEGGAPLLTTESATVSTVVDRTFVDNLPLNGRSFQTLVLLTPGVVPTVASLLDQGQFSVNGQRADANYFSVDGVSANFGVTGFFPLTQTAGGGLPALSATGGTNSLVSVDAMQEFRVQTSSFAPEFGRMPGGQISIATRSGTRSFHGTLFEYFRNGALDANSWFANFNHLAKPEEKQNDFGGVFGGPIFRDKTFFFFSYEGQRLRQPFTAQSVVPDLGARQSAPAAMQPFLNAYPLPNGAAVGPGVAQFNAGYSNPSSLDTYSIRLDEVVSSKVNLFARYNYSSSRLDQRDAPFTTSTLNDVDSLESSIHTFTVGATELITPTLSNEVRLNYSNQRLATVFDADDFGGAAPPSDSLLFPTGFTSADSAFLLLISGVGEYGRGKSGTDEQRQINVIDNLSWTKGSHQLKFGVDYRWLAPFSSPFVYRNFVQFTGVTSSPGGALSGIAAFAQPATFQATALLSQNFSLFVQDTWKITPRLTVTYGMRWEINPALKGKNSASDPFTVIGLNDPATMTLAPRGTSLYDTTYGNVAPRVGLAWHFADRPRWSTVFRAGFGIFYDLGQGSLGAASADFPYAAPRNLFSVPFPLSAQNAVPPALTTNLPVPNMVVADPHLKLPRSYQWNAAVEQTMGEDQSISLTYVGAIGRDLLRVTNLFNPNPNFQAVGVTDNSSTSDYHALQVRFERRLARGLQALASYTWSHSIDISSSDSGTQLSTPGAIAGPQIDRGDSDFDIRHSFTAGITFSLPAPKSQPIAKAVFGGWSLDSFILARSAPPANVVSGTFFVNGVGLTPRPNVIPGVPLELEDPQFPGRKIFNKAAFSPVPAGQQGDFGRNVLRGFGATQVDVAVQRQFHITEKLGLRFRSEFFNLFNHPNFGIPINTLTSALFGRSTQTLANSLGSGGPNGGFSPLYQIGGPRSIQVAMKLQF
jgi:Carboxypeptidase regulatory-like domain/TonB dependent receptor